MNKVTTADGLPVELSLVISTGHMPVTDDGLLRSIRDKNHYGDFDLDVEGIWVKQETEYGYSFVCGLVDPCELEVSLVQMFDEGFSHYLVGVLRYAFTRGIRTVTFDADGDRVDCFAWHDWAVPPGVGWRGSPSVVRNNPSTLLTVVSE